jgi:hypothetical protein
LFSLLFSVLPEVLIVLFAITGFAKINVVPWLTGWSWCFGQENNFIHGTFSQYVFIF